MTDKQVIEKLKIALDFERTKRKSLQADLKEKEQECEVLALDARVADNHLQHRIEMCDLLGEKLKAKEQECEELKRELQAQRDFTRHEQKLIYCAAYDETCKTGNDCKQKECIFKDNIKLKQTLNEIKEICKFNFTIITTNLLAKTILQKISECEV